MTAQRACNHIERTLSENYQTNFSLFSSGGGGILVFIKLFEITNEPNYINRALSVARIISKNRYGYPNNDVLTGRAGGVLTLLSLYIACNEDWIIKEITNLVDEIMSEIILTPRGICWDRSPNNLQPLCGFGHGASGMAHLFGVLFYYSGNSFFKVLADQCFIYEDSLYSVSEQNWPDLRRAITYNNEYIKYLQNSSLSDSLLFPKYMSAWCHGAIGIGIANIVAYYIFGGEEKLYKFQIALNSLGKQLAEESTFNVYNASLCHGILGNINLLIDGYCILNEEKYYITALNAARKCIARKSEVGFYIRDTTESIEECDFSLFLGKSGIGLTYLRLYTISSFSILSPFENNAKIQSDHFSKYNEHYFIETLFSNRFQQKDSAFGFVYKIDGAAGRGIRESIIAELLREAAGDNDKRKMLELDLANFKVMDSTRSNAHLFLAYTKSTFFLNKLTTSNNNFVVRNPHMQIRKCYNGNDYVLFIPSVHGSRATQIYIDDKLYNTLSLFGKKERRIIDVFNDSYSCQCMDLFMIEIAHLCKEFCLLITR